MGKVNNIQKHMGWRKKDGNSKNLKEILGEIISETRKCFDGLSSWLDTNEKIISELLDW